MTRQGSGDGLRELPGNREAHRKVAAARGVSVEVEKVENLADLLGYGVMSTPGVVIDDQVVHAGGVPNRSKVG